MIKIIDNFIIAVITTIGFFSIPVIIDIVASELSELGVTWGFLGIFALMLFTWFTLHDVIVSILKRRKAKFYE